jgi:hypothetical protein
MHSYTCALSESLLSVVGLVSERLNARFLLKLQAQFAQLPFSLLSSSKEENRALSSMVATRFQKRVALEKSNPLKEPGILHRILDYLGLGHYLFIALVNREWKLLYGTLNPCKLEGLDEEHFFCKS